MKKSNKRKSVSCILKDSSQTFSERSKLYGNAYENVGSILSSAFPEGVKLSSKEDFSRLYALIMCVSKINRYASNLEKGGHQDSAHDCIVYAAMLESFTEEK